MDATDPLLSFGMLPMRCLNDQGRVMSLISLSYWIDIATPHYTKYYTRAGPDFNK